MRILGIDYGDARIGLAISDLMGVIASPLDTYESKGMKKDIDYIANLVKEKQVTAIVLGLPLNLDGSIGFRASKTQALGQVLSRVTQIPVIYQDERLTTVTAEEILIEGNVSREKRKKLIDKMAARLILQSYLDCKK